MKQTLLMWWTQQAARIDALSQRERLVLFVTVIVSCLAVADLAWLSPAQSQYKQAVQRFGLQNAELAKLRTELSSIPVTSDSNQPVRAELATAAAKLQTLELQIQALAPQAQGAPALEQVLVQFLKRQDGLTLLGLRTLEPGGAASAPVNASSPNPLASMASAPPGVIPTAAGQPQLGSAVSKRGVELRVSGPYAELVRYVQALELALPGLRWGRMQLKADNSSPVLTVQVFLVGLEP